MLLALLVINANRVVTTDRLLDELWGEDAEGKENALWVYISRLRSALGDEGSLVTRDHGYSLIVDDHDLDVRRFESAIAGGRAVLRHDPELASSLLSEGLDLWRGPALEEFEYDDFAQSEIRRLTELRLAALEDRIDADLRRGLAGELVGELEVLHREHPTRERTPVDACAVPGRPPVRCVAVLRHLPAASRRGTRPRALTRASKARGADPPARFEDPGPLLPAALVGGVEDRFRLHSIRGWHMSLLGN